MLFTVHPPASYISVRRRHGIFVNGLPCQLPVEVAKSLSERFGNKRICMGSNHNVCIARIGPLGHPPAFFEILQIQAEEIELIFSSRINVVHDESCKIDGKVIVRYAMDEPRAKAAVNYGWRPQYRFPRSATFNAGCRRS